MIKHYFFVFLFVISSETLTAQQSELSQNIVQMTKYFNSAEYKAALAKGDYVAIDSIYAAAFEICGRDIQNTLLCLTFTCLPYNHFTIGIPLTRLKITIPVYSADSALFYEKNNLLPNDVYFDSPRTHYGDKDKLAHFFGGAFLSYSLRSKYFAEYIGYCVEMFEEVFKVDSMVDVRDIRTNTLGNLFGRNLRKEDSLKPSAYFAFYNLLNIIR